MQTEPAITCCVRIPFSHCCRRGPHHSHCRSHCTHSPLRSCRSYLLPGGTDHLKRFKKGVWYMPHLSECAKSFASAPAVAVYCARCRSLSHGQGERFSERPSRSLCAPVHAKHPKSPYHSPHCSGHGRRPTQPRARESPRWRGNRRRYGSTSVCELSRPRRGTPP